MPHSSVKPGAVDLSLEDLLGLLGSSQARPHDNAPDMPVPNINRDRGGSLPQMPMAAPPNAGNPLEPFGSSNSGNPWLLNQLKSQATTDGFNPFSIFGSSGPTSGPGPLPNPSGFAESFGGPLGGGGGFSPSSIGPLGWATMIMAGKSAQARDPNSFMGKALHGLLGPSISQMFADPLNTLLGPFQGFTSSKARNTLPEWMGLGK
jgi:hypothetical protein